LTKDGSTDAIKADALTAVGNLGGSDDIPMLMAYFDAQASTYITQKAAALALATLGGASVAEFLGARVPDASAIAAALGYLNRCDLLVPLLFDEKQGDGRYSVLRTLAEYKSLLAVDPLI
jgi:hypothetical protein